MTFNKTLGARPSGIGSCASPGIKLIGTKAYRYLNAPQFSGLVIAAGTRSAYIVTGDGNILAACRLDQQPHPRSFLTDMDLGTLHVGLRTWTEGAELRFSNGISLNLRECQVWNRQTLTAATAASVQKLRSRCHILFQAALDLQKGENLGLALPLLTMGADVADSARPPNSTSPLIASCVEGIKGLLPECLDGNLESTLKLAEHLVGLGPGLTPSGDDFIGGLIFMSLHLNGAYPAECWWENGGIGGLLARSGSMTSQISHALLTDLSEGQSHASLHNLADALISNAASFDATEHVRCVAKIGQSSGWDMLTGMLAALLPVIHRV